MLNQVVSQPVSMQLWYRLFFDYAFVGFSVRVFLDQLVMHAGNIVERHPSPEHMLNFGN